MKSLPTLKDFARAHIAAAKAYLYADLLVREKNALTEHIAVLEAQIKQYEKKNDSR